MMCKSAGVDERLSWSHVCVVLLLVSCCHTAPTHAPQLQAQDEEVDYGNGNGNGNGNITGIDEVKQLQDLKTSFGKTFAILKSQSSSVTEDSRTGKQERHRDTLQQVSGDGEVLSEASVHEHEDSSQGDRETTPQTRVVVEKERVQRRRQGAPLVRRTTQPFTNGMERLSLGMQMQYSPLDMAEYVFWTGDEKGVTLAIEEFLQEGLMTRSEAISFLQEIKYNLDYLQTHYAQMGLGKQPDQQTLERAALIQKALELDRLASQPELSVKSLDGSFGFSKKSYSQQESTNKEFLAALRLQQASQQPPSPPITQGLGSNGPLSDEDYEELLERLRVADFLYTEYSLEEVIYQLAKVMFSQSLHRGSGEAQQALNKFTNFLEGEAEQGHISRSLEKKVLDVLIASLTDTLTENPHLINAAREELLDSGVPSSSASPKANSQFMHLLLNPNSGRLPGKDALSSSAEQQQQQRHRVSMTSPLKKNRNALTKP